MPQEKQELQVVSRSKGSVPSISSSNKQKNWSFRLFQEEGRDEILSIKGEKENLVWSIPGFTKVVKERVDSFSPLDAKRLQVDDIPESEPSVKGVLQVHKSTPQSFFATIQDGRVNNTFEIFSEDGRWTVSPRKRPTKKEPSPELEFMDKLMKTAGLEELLYPIATPRGGSDLARRIMASSIGAVAGAGLQYADNKSQAEEYDENGIPIKRNATDGMLGKAALGGIIGLGVSEGTNFLAQKFVTPPMNTDPTPESLNERIREYDSAAADLMEARAAEDKEGQEKVMFKENKQAGLASELSNVAGWGLVFSAPILSLVGGALAYSKMEKKMKSFKKDHGEEDVAKIDRLGERMGVSNVPVLNYGNKLTGAYSAGPGYAYQLSLASPGFRRVVKKEMTRKGFTGTEKEFLSGGFMAVPKGWKMDPIIRHEMGHSNLTNRKWTDPSKLNQEIARPIADITGSFAPIASLIAGSIVGAGVQNAMDNSIGRNTELSDVTGKAAVILAGALTGATIGAAIGSPTLGNEAQVSRMAMDDIEKDPETMNRAGGPDKFKSDSKGMLGAAYNTYLGSKIRGPAILGMGGALLGSSGYKLASFDEKRYTMKEVVKMIMEDPGIPSWRKEEIINDLKDRYGMFTSEMLTRADLAAMGLGGAAGWMLGGGGLPLGVGTLSGAMAGLLGASVSKYLFGTSLTKGRAIWGTPGLKMY